MCYLLKAVSSSSALRSSLWHYAGGSPTHPKQHESSNRPMHERKSRLTVVGADSGVWHKFRSVVTSTLGLRSNTVSPPNRTTLRSTFGGTESKHTATRFTLTDKHYWYDDQPHPHDVSLQSTFPHHKHIHPDIKHHRIPAAGIQFDQSNLPFLVQETLQTFFQDSPIP